MQELMEAFSIEQRPVKLVNRKEITTTVNGVNPENLLGGLFSSSEMIIDPRQAIATLPAYLSEVHNVDFVWNKAVTYVEPNTVYFADGSMEADLICICSGADFETLYPSLFDQLKITKCKLQMMRFVSQQPAFRIGTSLCGGLSLIHYDSFKAAPSLPLLKERYQNELPEYLRAGIHVMVSQNAQGELTVGDSHEYGTGFSPFDEAKINELILDYLKTFAKIEEWQLIQSWHGIYSKMTNGQTDIFIEADKGVYIVNGLGGAGMTLSFGFAEEVITSLGVKVS
jgi:FAD dependent oxidoreductase TIGR03364